MDIYIVLSSSGTSTKNELIMYTILLTNYTLLEGCLKHWPTDHRVSQHLVFIPLRAIFFFFFKTSVACSYTVGK